jgi:excisionase family DNA binding protein
MESLMTSEDVAEHLKVEVVTVRRLVNRGELAAYRVGGEFRFSRADLEGYLQRQRVPARAEASGSPLDLVGQFVQKLFPKGRPGARESFEALTKRARRVLELSQEEAQHLQHNYIGTEHLLLGLLREGDGVAAQVLKRMGVDLEQARNQVIFIIGQGEHPTTGELPMTPRAKQVIEFAFDEALRLGHRFLGTEHLLLGLLREGRGVGAQVLKKLGVDLEEARAQTIQILSEHEAAPPEVPAEAAGLLAEGEAGQVCPRCGARSPGYFRHCFHCGLRLEDE